MQEKTYDIPLHDIKTIVEVQEYSLYYLIGFSTLGLLIVGALLYLLYTWYKKRNAYNQRREHFKILNALDLNDTKNTAYAISLYGVTFKNDSERHSGMYQNIMNRLEIYKYKKDVEKFDEEILGYIEVYKSMLDV